MSELLQEEAREQETARTSWTEETLSEENIAALIVDLTPSEDVRQGRKYGIHVIDGSDVRANIGRRVEWLVFDTYFQNDLNVMREEYEPYDPYSTFIIAVDYERQRPMGVVRMVRPSPVGLKSLTDLLQQPEWNVEKTSLDARMQEIGATADNLADIATMAVAPEYKTNHSENGASAALYSSYVRWSLENGFNYSIAIVDKKIYGMIQAWGNPLKSFDNAEWSQYLNSAAKPVHLELNEGLRQVAEYDAQLRAQGHDVDIHGLYTQGKGIADQFVLPEFEVPVQYMQ